MSDIQKWINDNPKTLKEIKKYEWSDKAMDYSAGTDLAIYNFEKKDYTILTFEQASNLPPDMKRRVVIRPRKIGCPVYTLEYCKYLMEQRDKNECK